MAQYTALMKVKSGGKIHPVGCVLELKDDEAKQLLAAKAVTEEIGEARAVEGEIELRIRLGIDENPGWFDMEMDRLRKAIIKYLGSNLSKEDEAEVARVIDVIAAEIQAAKGQDD